MGLIDTARQLWNAIGAKTAEDSITPTDVNNAAQAICDAVEGIELKPGPAGKSITESSIDANGHLIITLSDDSTIDAGLAKGTAGNDGKYVKNSSIDANGHLIITLSDNSTIDAGLAKGAAGNDGKNGWLYTPAFAASTDTIVPDFANELYQTTNTGTAAIAMTDFLNLPKTSTERLLAIYNNRASAMSVTFRTADLVQDGWTYKFENMMPATCSIPAGKRCEICYLFVVSSANTMKVVITYLVQS